MKTQRRDGLLVRPEFEELLEYVTKDPYKIRLPALLQLQALKSMELSENVESNLQVEHSRAQRYQDMERQNRARLVFRKTCTRQLSDRTVVHNGPRVHRQAPAQRTLEQMHHRRLVDSRRRLARPLILP